MSFGATYLQTFTPHNEIYGNIHNNSSIDMRPFEDKNVDNDELKTELRMNKPSTLGFIDCNFTPMSVEAGRVRTLVQGIGLQLQERMLSVIR